MVENNKKSNNNAKTQQKSVVVVEVWENRDIDEIYIFNNMDTATVFLSKYSFQTTTVYEKPILTQIPDLEEEPEDGYPHPSTWFNFDGSDNNLIV